MNIVFYKQQYANHIHVERNQGPFWWLWMLVLPLVPILAYALLGYLKVFPVENGIPRDLYIIVGITSWLIFSDGVVKPTISIARFKPYFIRQEISLAELVTAWIPERLGEALVQLIFCLSLVWVGLGFNLTGLGLYFLIILSGVLLFNTLGVLFAVSSLIWPSSTNIITTTNRFLIFLSAVIFPIPDGVVSGYIKFMNPYYVFIDGSRAALIGQDFTWLPIVIWSIFAVVLVILIRIGLSKITTEVRDFLQ